MSEWQPIETAPKDGHPVRAGKMTERLGGWVPYPLTSRFLDGRWAAEFDGKWHSYDPQPTHWMPQQSALNEKASV